MTDHFAALQQPRRPWLDADAVKEAFHRATATHHPDVTGGDDARFAELNAAQAALREPASRLRHLLELEAPQELTRPQAIPNELADLFMRLAGQRQKLAAFAQASVGAKSALAKALLAGEKSALVRDCTAALAQLDAAHEEALAELRALDAAWDSHRDETLARLAALHQRFAFLAKWRSQLRESLFQLSS